MQSNDPQDIGVHRILVAIDSSTESAHALEAAAQLAAHMQAEIEGMFVEDPNLLRLEELSSSRGIQLPQGFGGAIESGSMRRQLQAHARRARQMLERASEQLQITWNFRVERGSMRSKLKEASSEFDLVVVESQGRSVRSAMRLEASTREAAQELDRPVLFLQKGARAIRSVVAVFDDTPESLGALDVATNLLATPISMLTVLVPARSREEADALREKAEEHLSHAGVTPHFRRISPDQVEWIGRSIREIHGDILIQAANSKVFEHNSTKDLLDEVDCPVLLVQ